MSSDSVATAGLMRGRAGWVEGGKVVVRQKWPDFTAISQPAGKAQPPGSSALRVAARLRFDLGLGPLYGLAGGRIEYWMRPQELPGRPAIRIDGDWLTLLSGGVAASIPRFIALELLGALRCAEAFRQLLATGRIAVLRIERVVYFALEVAGAMKHGPTPTNTPPLNHSEP